MNILFATPYGGVPGGISRWAEHIVNYHNTISDNVVLDVLSMGRSSFVNIGSPLLYRLKSAYKDYSLILREFDKKLDQNHYDIMHLASSGSLGLLRDIFMLKKAKKKGIRTFIHFHFGRIPDLEKMRNWEWKLINYVIKLADQVIVIDKNTFDTLTSLGYNHINYLPNPIAPKVLDIAEKNINAEREERSILFVGHVVQTKGVYELVNACKEIKNIKLSLVGYVDLEVRKELEAIANGEWLDIVGELPYEEVIKRMLCCDIFILPTYTEGFPNVILESMACRCVIIASAVGAIPEMLSADGEKYGFLIQPKSVLQIKNAIENIIDDSFLKERLRNKVLQRVIDCYSINIVWQEMLKIWNKNK